MMAAAAMAKDVGAELALIDRDIHITLKRTWASLGMWRKVTLLGAVVEGLVSKGEVESVDIEQLKERAELSRMMKEFAELLPEVHKPLIDERDRFMMSAIGDTVGQKVVAVVGAAHVEGMTRYFGADIDREEISRLPAPKSWVKALKWVIPSLILGAFYIGWSRHEGGTLEQMIKAWILPNSIMAALLTSFALAKPLSILTAFVASPITSLNPLLPAGVVVGLVEAWLRKPTVEDCERINEDVQSLRGIYKNQFTRVLLVAFLATMGSALGAWVGLGWVFSLVGS